MHAKKAVMAATIVERAVRIGTAAWVGELNRIGAVTGDDELPEVGCGQGLGR